MAASARGILFLSWCTHVFFCVTGPMNVSIRSASPTSINLSWDPFLPAGSSNGQYIVYYTDAFTETISGWRSVIEVSIKSLGPVFEKCQAGVMPDVVTEETQNAPTLFSSCSSPTYPVCGVLHAIVFLLFPFLQNYLVVCRLSLNILLWGILSNHRWSNCEKNPASALP